MTEPMIVRMEKFHLEEIYPERITPEATASLLSFPSFALEHAQKTIAIGGAIPIWSGRVRLWLLVSVTAPFYAVRILRACRMFTEIALSENVRVECICEDNLSARVAKMLGYSQDCILRNYRDGKDAKLFSITGGKL